MMEPLPDIDEFENRPVENLNFRCRVWEYIKYFTKSAKLAIRHPFMRQYTMRYRTGHIFVESYTKKEWGVVVNEAWNMGVCVKPMRIGSRHHKAIGIDVARLTRLYEEFAEDESKFYSIMNRIAALMRLLADDERVKPYLKTDPTDSEHTMINNTLIEVMAKFPISDDGELDKDAFFREVKELIENEKH